MNNTNEYKMIINSKLTNRGYIVNKSDLTFKQIQKIKKDLTVQAFTAPDFPKSDPYTINKSMYDKTLAITSLLLISTRSL